MSFPAIDKLPPVHPGEILKDELDAMNMSARKFAEHIGVPANAVTGVLNGQRGVTAAMALRLGQAFDMDPGFWTALQSLYETKVARKALGASLRKIRKLPRITGAAA